MVGNLLKDVAADDVLSTVIFIQSPQDIFRDLEMSCNNVITCNLSGGSISDSCDCLSGENLKNPIYLISCNIPQDCLYQTISLLSTRQNLSHQISNIISGRNITNNDFFHCDCFSNSMVRNCVRLLL